MTPILPRLAAMLALTTALAGPAFAQNAPAPTPAAAVAPSSNAMVNLVRALVAKGTLTPEAGQALIAQAEAEARQVQASAPPPGTVRVPYVPESVRAQIRDELKADVLQTARAEGWAQPGRVQDWVGHVKIFGDFRYRAQFNFFGRGNANDVIDFNQFNAGGPTEINPSVAGSTFAPPLLNTTRDRLNRQNIRLRFGLTAQIADPVDVTFRLATGDNNGPVSTTSQLGGGFSKKDVFVDQAFVNLRPIDGLVLTGGRMPNPFYSQDVIWDPDLNFDGITLAGDSGERFGERLKLHAVVGAFPLEYGSDRFQSTSNPSVNRARSTNKWLYAAQLFGVYQFRHDISLKAGAAYYHFDSIQGRPSDPCETFVVGTECSTDPLRPAFLQKGNTVFALRNIVGPPGSVNFSQRQFVGLTFDYNVLNLNADATITLDEKKRVLVGGNYIRNLAFRRSDVCKLFRGNGTTTADTQQGPINNIGQVRDAQGNLVTVLDPTTNTQVPINPCADLAPSNSKLPFQGGDTAWEAHVSVGYPEVGHFAEWNVTAAYKYIETDAVLDALVDNEFHLGGTNAQGYTIAGTFGLFDNVAARAKWLSANQISGPPLAIDVLQLELLVAF